MTRARRLAAMGCLLAIVQYPSRPRWVATALVAPEVCFARGTPPDVVRRVYERLYAARRAPRIPLFQFQDGNRWSGTATDPGPLSQGDPTTIRWSIVPDGTLIPGSAGEPDSASTLIADFNFFYGDQGTWLALFQQVFDRWGELTGIAYVYEPNDDGAAFPSEPSQSPGAPGVIGVRGDVRISGHDIDGPLGILAYNFFPDIGDMVIDSPDLIFDPFFFGDLPLRNTVAHEHGHGLGFSHACPVDDTKLMEPSLSFLLDGPQHDDTLAGQRGYGDDKEANDSLGAATDLGSLGNGSVAVNGVSADDNGDVDRYKFTVAAGKTVSVAVTPVGFTYLEGPQNMDGSCSAGTSFNSLTLNDVGFQLIGTDGTTVLATASAQPAGAAETLNDFVLGAGGTYSLRVFAGANNQVQLYDFSMTIADAPPSGAVVSATKTVSGTFEAGGAISYGVILTNNGATQGDNPGDEFTDTLPGALALVSANATSGIATAVGNTVTWNGSLAMSASVTITIDATINAGTQGAVISNQGTVHYDADANGTNEATALTDDPGQPGAADPTLLFVGSGGVDFFTLPPCRILDTRTPAGPLGGPALNAQADRTFPVAGTCGIPATAKAISVNLAVTQPTVAGNLRLRPGGVPVPLVSSINYIAGQTRSNNAVVPLNASGEITVFCGQASGTVQFILDVNGYFE